ncbi:PepSY domain-containing protein [Pseudoalteromonas maricaloris]|uniref:PepSY domain-containing protein n=1 Tax=Pseudoalteromonas maricaloris TaxID=184924 RepID=UPI0021ADD5BA|nr:PepSY domain-containing protein [Pseudoalteromonas flavipulchra]
MADKARQRKRLRKLYDLHAWVGFQLAAVMFVILATGTIATVSNELDWLVFEQMRASQKPKEVKEQTAASWRNMYASIAERYPEGRVTTLGTMGATTLPIEHGWLSRLKMIGMCTSINGLMK